MFLAPSFFKFFLLTIFLIAIDQVSKVFVLNSGLFYQCNSGVAFGFLSGSGNFLNLPVSLLVLIVVLFLLLRERSGFLKLAYIFIFAGGVSNVVDRIVRGCVVDFLNFGNVPLLGRLPIFNFADVAITLGVSLVVLMLIFNKNYDSRV